MDLDVISKDELTRVIYGHPYPWPEYSQCFARSYGITVPCHICALQTPLDEPPDHSSGCFINLHPGLVYWIGASEDTEPVATTPEALVGPLVRCAAVTDLIPAIRRAIVALRQLELSQLEAPVSLPLMAAERAQFRLCLGQLRAGSPDASETLDGWLQMVRIRYQQTLNGMRRRLLELLTAVTCDCEEAGGLGRFVELTVADLYSTYALGDLHTRFRAHMLTIAATACKLRNDLGDGVDQTLIGRAQRFITGAYRSPILLRDVARAVGVSPSHLAREFKQQTGRTVGETLLQLRIREAKVLLTACDEPLKRIAPACGFSSSAHFQRLFKRETGEAPGAYRVRMRAGSSCTAHLS